MQLLLILLWEDGNRHMGYYITVLLGQSDLHNLKSKVFWTSSMPSGKKLFIHSGALDLHKDLLLN